MNLPDPFVYPPHAHIRKHDPAGYANYKEYKPWLRDEFEFRCVYCLQREMWSREGHAVFSVDHTMPQSEAPELSCVYTNLVYACVRCNSLKQDDLVVDPTQEPMGRHLVVDANSGHVDALTVEGDFLIELLYLNAPSLIKERLRILRIRDRYAANRHDDGVATDFMQYFDYPEDMPDLRTLRPPGGNRFSANREGCFYALRELCKLPQFY